MEFDSKRAGTGTMEWAETNVNICKGCRNNCLYCYAAANAKRFKTRNRDKWHIEAFTKRATMKSFPRKKGVIMFPSSHDITPFNLKEYLRVAKLILEKGNQLLVVSKPRMECITYLLNELSHFNEQILFRFTIGTVSEKESLFWEPGAPLPQERMECLTCAWSSGFKTSISIEPMLGGILGTEDVVKQAWPFVTDTIWIGKMNKIRSRVDMSLPANIEAVKSIELMQRDSEIMKLYRILSNNPSIRWKDSIKKIITKYYQK